MKGQLQIALFILILVGMLSFTTWFQIWKVMKAIHLAHATSIPFWAALLIVLK